MKTNQFNIILDLSILKKLRNKINEQYNISYSKQYGKYRAWDKICSIMDRLDDTVAYLNEIKLNTGKYRRSAFDFSYNKDAANPAYSLAFSISKNSIASRYFKN